jgi:hypothetical protein
VDNARPDHELIDDPLAREIEDAFDVEPSPAFVTRVLANRPAPRRWTLTWTFRIAVAGAAAAIVAAVAVIPERGARAPAPIATTAHTAPRRGQPPVVMPPASREETPVASARPAARERTRIASTPAPTAGAISAAAELDVVLAEGEAVALRRLMRGLSRGAVVPETLDTSAVTAIAAIQVAPIVLAPLSEMSPVTLEPLGALAEGVRQ